MGDPTRHRYIDLRGCRADLLGKQHGCCEPTSGKPSRGTHEVRSPHKQGEQTARSYEAVHVSLHASHAYRIDQAPEIVATGGGSFSRATSDSFIPSASAQKRTVAER